MATETAPPAAPVAEAPTPEVQSSEGGGFLDAFNAHFDEAGNVKETEEVKGKPPKVEAKAEAVEKKEKTGVEELFEKKEEKDDDLPELKNMTAKAGEHFKKIKARAEAAESQATEFRTKSESAATRIAEYEAKIKELETSTTQLAELDRIKQLNQEYEKEFALVKVEATPEFRKTVYEPMAKMISIAEEIAKAYDENGESGLKEKILSALEDSNPRTQAKKIQAFASEFDEADRYKLYTLGQDYQRVSERRSEIKANAGEALKQIEERQRQESEQSAAENKKNWLRETGQIWDRAKALISDLPAEEQTKIQGFIAAIDFDKEPIRNKVISATAGMILPHVLASNKKQAERIAELEAKVAAHNKAKPGAGSGNGQEIGEEKPKDTGGFLETVGPELDRLAGRR